MTTVYKKEINGAVIHISMSAQLENIDKVCQDVEECLVDLQLDDLSFGIQLVIREALANAVKHGSQGDPTKHVDFILHKQKKRLVIKVEDEGRGFTDSPPDTTNDDNILLCCGRGLKIMNQYFDKVTYNKQGNKLELIKKIK